MIELGQSAIEIFLKNIARLATQQFYYSTEVIQNCDKCITLISTSPRHVITYPMLELSRYR